jgi:hypothetical protein
VEEGDAAPEEARLEVATVLALEGCHVALEGCHVKRVGFNRSRNHLSEDLPK